MRQIVLDTETTGLEWKKGNRVVEIGCVELIERRPTGRTWQRYINPEREFEAGAQEVTGLSLDQLIDKPKFAEIADDFLEFVDGAELVIHNAAFDIGFLDYELSLLGAHYGKMIDRVQVEDSLELARQRFPGQRNSLDALCRRLGVANSHRHLHGALLDAQILVDVYLALTSGQGEMELAAVLPEQQGAGATAAGLSALRSDAAARPRVRVNADDAAAHDQRMDAIRKKAGGRCVWDAV